MKRKWNKQEDLFLAENYENSSNEELAVELNRTISSIKNRKVKLNLTKPQRNLSIYEVVKGYQVLATGTARECADALGLEIRTIYWYSSPAYLNQRAKDDSVMVYKLDDDEIEAM